MEAVYLFALANARRDWLSMRQSLVTQNIANASTPGYRSVDAAPFAQAMEQHALVMAADNPAHMEPAHGVADGKVVRRDDDVWETVHSGNNVALEAELIKQNEIRSAFTLDTNIVKAFHGMWMASLKG